jgi:glycosyltransferase involved in cell wall biosynthesis
VIKVNPEPAWLAFPASRNKIIVSEIDERSVSGGMAMVAMTPPRVPFRILFVEQNEDHSTGGSHRSQLLNVDRLDRARYEPVVAYYQDNEFAATMVARGVEVHLLANERARELLLVRRQPRFLRPFHIARACYWRKAFLDRHAIDLVHLNNSADRGVDTWLPAAKLARIPIVTDIRGDAHGVRGQLRRWLALGFDQMFPVSRYMADRVISNGLRADRITVVRLGIDVDTWQKKYRRGEQEIRAELNVRESDLLAVMVGNIREWKGQDVVVEAFTRMPSPLRERWVLALVGEVREEDKDYLVRVLDICERAGFRERVRVTGFRADIPDLLRASDVAIHASTVPEPGGRTVLEALASGTVVLAASEGGHTEFLATENPVGYTHSVDDPDQLAAHLAKFTSDPGHLGTMRRGATEQARRFPAHATAAAVQAFYEKLLCGRRPRARIDA